MEGLPDEVVEYTGLWQSAKIDSYLEIAQMRHEYAGERAARHRTWIDRERKVRRSAMFLFLPSWFLVGFFGAFRFELAMFFIGVGMLPIPAFIVWQCTTTIKEYTAEAVEAERDKTIYARQVRLAAAQKHGLISQTIYAN